MTGQERWWSDLVELYEYKVADLEAGRPPRGDQQALMDLRDDLMTANITDGRVRRRLMNTERVFRELHRQGRTRVSRQPQDHSRRDALKAERRAVKELSELLWQADARRWIFARLWAARHEPRLFPLRLLSAAIDNVGRMHRGQPAVPLMGLEEALTAGLGSVQQIEALTDATLPLMQTLPGRQRLRRAINDLWERRLFAEAPESLRGRAQGAPGSGAAQDTEFVDPRDFRPAGAVAEDSADLLVGAAAPVPPGAGGAGGGPVPLDPAATLWAEDAELLHQSVQVFNRLIDVWPSFTPPTLPVLHGIGTGAVSEPPATSLMMVRLTGQAAVRWQDLDLAWQPAEGAGGGGWTLEVTAPGGQRQRGHLRTDLPAALRVWQLQLGGRLIHALVRDDYLLIRTEQDAPALLSLLASRVQMAAALSHPQQAFAALRLARAGALALGGQPLSGDFGPSSALKYGAASPTSLGQLCVRGVETLLTRKRAHTDWETGSRLEAAAKAIGLTPAEGALLADLLNTSHLPDTVFDAEVLRSSQLPPTGVFLLLRWAGEAMHFPLGQSRLSLLPGGVNAATGDPLILVALGDAPPQPLDEVMALPTRHLTALVVQDGEWLAVCGLPR